MTPRVPRNMSPPLHLAPACRRPAAQKTAANPRSRLGSTPERGRTGVAAFRRVRDATCDGADTSRETGCGQQPLVCRLHNCPRGPLGPQGRAGRNGPAGRTGPRGRCRPHTSAARWRGVGSQKTAVPAVNPRGRARPDSTRYRNGALCAPPVRRSGSRTRPPRSSIRFWKFRRSSFLPRIASCSRCSSGIVKRLGSSFALAVGESRLARSESSATVDDLLVIERQWRQAVHRVPRARIRQEVGLRLGPSRNRRGRSSRPTPRGSNGQASRGTSSAKAGEEPPGDLLLAGQAAEGVELPQVNAPEAGPLAQDPRSGLVERLAAGHVAAGQGPEIEGLPLHQQELQIRAVEAEDRAVDRQVGKAHGQAAHEERVHVLLGDHDAAPGRFIVS